jgi:hypothetical protein
VSEKDWEQVRTLRAGQIWDEFGQAAKEDGTTRTALIKAFMRAYLAGPRAKMPRRPRRPTADDPGHDGAPPSPTTGQNGAPA